MKAERDIIITGARALSSVVRRPDQSAATINAAAAIIINAERRAREAARALQANKDALRNQALQAAKEILDDGQFDDNQGDGEGWTGGELDAGNILRAATLLV